jgi:hypothetical protein
MATIKSRNKKPASKWYICGGYVLDHLFGVSTAPDIDCCYFGLTERPEDSAVITFAKNLGMQAGPPNVQPIRVKDYYPEAGGFPSLNIDFLQLDMDGKVYEVDPKTEERKPYSFPGQIDLKIVDPAALTKQIAQKALGKLKRYPKLKCDVATRAALEAAAKKQ